MANLDSILKSRDISHLNVSLKKQRHFFANKVMSKLCPSSQSYGFSSSHVWMLELEKKMSAKELVLLNCGVGEDF